MRPVQIARRLRRDATDAERKLWARLRGRQLGHKFRRQVPIVRFIADVACIEAKLVVEVDGGEHNMHPYVVRDAERTAAIEAAGYIVMRFWNNDVLNNMEGVLQAIVETLGERTS